MQFPMDFGVVSMIRRTILAVGAHPDDVELGAGGLLSDLAARGYEIFVIVLTDEPESTAAARRREEAISAFSMLGIGRDHLAFAGFADGFLQVSRDSVSKVRDITSEWFEVPDLVITHSMSDLHPDHRAAWQLTAASIRNTAILGFPISNSFLLTGFQAAVWYNVHKQEQIKLDALRNHASQIELGRISPDRSFTFHRDLGRLVGQGPVELFDLNIPYDSARSEVFLKQLLWSGVCSGTEIFNFRAGDLLMDGARHAAPLTVSTFHK